MYEAYVGDLNATLVADEYENLSAARRNGYADSLRCTGCNQPAYFIRQARNGRAACFGAPPHLDGCELASTSTEDGGYGSLAEDGERLTARDEFVLRPISEGRAVRHVAHDPLAPHSTGRARRYTAVGYGAQSTPSMGLSVLLRRLIRNPDFRTSRAVLVLPDGTRGSIRTQTVEVIDADLGMQNKRRLYWGTIRYANVFEDKVWLNLGRRGAPMLALSHDFTSELLERSELEDIEELQGCSFLTFAHLRKGRETDRMFLFPSELDWFALRLPDGDPL